MRRIWQQHRLLILLLTASFAFRVVLNLRGGQLFWPDESRYFRSVILLYSLNPFNLGRTLRFFFTFPDHVFSTAVGFIPAVFQRVAAKAFGGGRPTDLASMIWVAAAVLSLSSVANIGLTYALARRLGAGKAESLGAAFLMACSCAMFYWSRHLLPYDSSLMFALVALWVGLGERPRASRSLACGMLAGLAFLTYYGCWTVAGMVVAVHVLHGWVSVKEAAKRAVLGGLGFVAPLLMVSAAVFVLRGESFLGNMRRFSRGTALYNVASEDWSLPWEYLWHAEHGLLLVWAGGLIAAVGLILKKDDAGARARGATWILTAAAIYLTLASGIFAVYGRLSRQLIPFLCLAAACGLSHLLRSDGALRRLALPLVGVILLQTAYNFAQPLTMKFPHEAIQSVINAYGQPDYDVTVHGNLYILSPQGEGATLVYGDTPLPGGEPLISFGGAHSRYVLLNPGIIWPADAVKEPPAGREVFRVPHPLTFLPYLYDAGYKPDERARLRSTDISVRLLDKGVAP